MTRSSRILVLSQVPPPVHGSTIVTAFLLDTLRIAGYETDLVDRRFSTSVRQVGRFRLRKLVAAPHLFIRFALRLVLRRPQVCIFFITNRKFSALVDWALIETLRAFRVPFVLYVHTTGYEHLRTSSRFWAFVLGRQFNRASRVVVLGRTLTDDVRRIAPSGRVSVIENATLIPASVGRGDSPRPRPDGPRSVLFFSNLIAEKGALTFAEVGRELVGDGYQAEFVLRGAAGDSETLRLVQEVSDQVGSSLRYEGPVDAENKWQLLEGSDLLVFPSTYPFEAQPMTIIEAMAAGCAVVAFDVGGVSDLVVNGVNGVLVPAGDVPALKAAVASLLDDTDRLEDLRRGAQAHFERSHSASEYVRKWNDVLYNLKCIPTQDGAHR